MAETPPEARRYFDEAVAGRRVEADGGSLVSGLREGQTVLYGSRETFEGTLTGQRLDVGDPPWRWLEIGELTLKPEGFEEDSVWCEESYVYFV